MECLPRNFAQLKGDASSKLMSLPQGSPHPVTQDKDTQNPGPFASSQGKPEGPSHLQDSPKDWLRPLLQLHHIVLILPRSASLIPCTVLPRALFNKLPSGKSLCQNLFPRKPNLLFHCSPLFIYSFYHCVTKIGLL